MQMALSVQHHDPWARPTLGTRGISHVWREFSVLAEGRHMFCCRPKPRAAGHYKDLTETGNRARKVSGTQGSPVHTKPGIFETANFVLQIRVDRALKPLYREVSKMRFWWANSQIRVFGFQRADLHIRTFLKPLSRVVI